MPTALEIAQGRNVPLTTGLMMAIQTRYPLLSSFDARTTADKTFKTLAVTELPSSAFVNFNEGFTASRGKLALREFACSLIGGLIAEDVITSDEWNRAHPAAGYTYMDLQMQLKIIADARHIERQMVYGTARDAKGFPGMKELTPYASGNVLELTESADDTDFVKTVLNAGGSTASTASSVYSVIFGDMDCQLVIGNDQGGELFTLGEMINQMLAPDSSQPTKLTQHRAQQLHGFFGLAVAGMNQTPNDVVPTQYSLRRLANLTAQDGKGVTDAKLERLVLSHGDGLVPSMLYMSPRGGDQWAASRSASSVSVFLGGMTTAQGSQVNLQAPRPTNYEGIPVTYTSAIRNTDAIEA